MAKLKNTGMIRVGNAVLKERNPASFSLKISQQKKETVEKRKHDGSCLSFSFAQ